MKKIIKLPTQSLSKRFDVSSTPNKNFLKMDTWSFECTTCDTKSSIDSKGMIFKNVEFYCSSCGTYHKLTNPAFPNNKK